MDRTVALKVVGILKFQSLGSSEVFDLKELGILLPRLQSSWVSFDSRLFSPRPQVEEDFVQFTSDFALLLALDRAFPSDPFVLFLKLNLLCFLTFKG
ncbi:hypothetical protein V6N13_037553 [Hibiscus sabdariffa]